MKSIFLVFILSYGLSAHASERELGTVCEVDCRYNEPTPRAAVAGEKQWLGAEFERYLSARRSARIACEASGGRPASKNGYVCCTLERVDGVVTPSRCTLP